MSNYRDLNTGQEYDNIPEGKVQPYIVNGQAVTQKAYETYMEDHPKELEELVVVPKEPRSTTMQAYYDRLANISPNNYIKHLNQKYEDQRINKANHWSGTLNLISPNQYFGAAFDKRPYWTSVWYGNSGYVPEKFASENPRLSALLNMAGDAALGLGTSKFYSWGTKPRIAYGTETPIVEYTHFSPRVTKHSTITPSEMHVRNNTAGFIKSNYKGVDSNGLYVYTQPKMIFPRNPRIAFNKAISKALRQGYQKITHPNLQGIALMNKRLNRVISDFGDTGYGQVGWTWYGRPGFGDAAVETVPAFKLAMEKKGGKLGNNK